MAIEAKFRELLGMPEKQTDPKPVIDFIRQDDERFNELRFKVESEPGFFIPCHLLLPKKFEGKIPVVIAMQGHATGMHISLGRPIYPGDENDIKGGDRDFCLQAVARGYAAVAMEQRGFGELVPTIGEKERCLHVALGAFEVGRTLIGERISDVSRLIDALSAFEMLDLDRIAVTGNELVEGVASRNESEILSETLGVELIIGKTLTHEKAWNINGENVTLSVERV